MGKIIYSSQSHSEEAMRAHKCLAQSLECSKYSLTASTSSQLAQVVQPGKRASLLSAPPSTLSCTECPLHQVTMLQAFPLPHPWEMSAKQMWGAEDREAERPSALRDLDPSL